MKIQKTNKGFTLIELLVVITIIGILATGSVTVFTSQIQKARDSTRLSDIGNLKSAIEQFYNDAYEYPEGGDFGQDGEVNGLSVAGLKSYLPKLPIDPKDQQTCNNAGDSSNDSICAYRYVVADDKNGITNGAYEISTAFENDGNMSKSASNDKDGGNDEQRYEDGLINGATNAMDTSLHTVSDIETTDLTVDTSSTDKDLVITKGGVYVRN